MRKIHTIALALAGVALGVTSLTFAMAATTATPDLTRRAMLPGIAADSSSNNPGATTSTPVPSGCAGFRTPVRILTDAGAGFDRTPVASSLFALVAATRPDGLTDSSARISPFESRVVEVTATLVGFRRTSGGGVELVISQGAGGDIMLAAFPSVSCMADASDADRAAVSSARIALQQVCGNAPDSGVFKPLGGTAKFQGVPFWGSKRTDGMGSPSGIELGPVLGFEFNPATSCDANASKTPFPTATATPVLLEILMNVNPQEARPGDTVTLTVITVPAIAGRSCSHKLTDSNSHIVSQGSKLTGADGKASWVIILPANMPLGQARATPSCVGGNTDGSEPIDIVP